jgi:Ca2+-binding EF-hand superfamily protein
MFLYNLDHDFLLDLHEFLEGCAVLFISKGDKKKKLSYIFDLYDVNLDGYLTKKEIQSGFHALFTMIGADNSEAVLSKLAEASLNEMVKITECNNSKNQNPKISKGSKYPNIL